MRKGVRSQQCRKDIEAYQYSAWSQVLLCLSVKEDQLVYFVAGRLSASGAIQIYADGNVTELDLTRNVLKGSIPYVGGNLSALARSGRFPVKSSS